MRTQIFLMLLTLYFSANPAHAAIMGMLFEGNGGRVEYATQDGKVEIRLIDFPEMKSLIITRYLPSEGGNVAAVMAALQAGKIPLNPVSGWVRPDADEKPTLVLALFYPDHLVEFKSIFSGKLVKVPHKMVSRFSEVQDDKGSNVQIFKISPSLLLADINESLQFQAGNQEIKFVTQSTSKGDFDVTVKGVRINTEKLKANHSLGGAFDSACGDRLK